MNLLPILIAVIALAFFTGSDSLFYLAYLLGGIWVLTFIWMRQALVGLHTARHFSERAFHGEQVTAELVVANKGRWPILWLNLHESVPLALHVPNFERHVVSLSPGEQTTIRYQLNCGRRGYYHLGPLSFRTGDFFDLSREREANCAASPFIVYPRVLPLRRLALPSQLPFGDLASRQRIFEDPSRFFGVRDYQPGDSLRQINWKSSARGETLLVKRFQPAIALNTLVILNLNTDEYSLKSRAMSSELGIVIAASVAAHLVEKRQPVGLAVLGLDSITERIGLQVIPPVRGREHLMRLLEALARAELASTVPFISTLDEASARLGWGSTAVVITPGESPNLADALVQMQRRGIGVLLVATDPQTPFPALRRRLEQIGTRGAAYWMTQEQDLDVWR